MPRKPVTARTSFSVAETFLGQPARMLANEVLEIGRCDGRFPAHVFGGAKSLQPLAETCRKFSDISRDPGKATQVSGGDPSAIQEGRLEAQA